MLTGVGDGTGWVSEAEMIEVDRVMVDELGIALVQMMENAGRHLAQFVIDRHRPASVVVAAGSGGNGGGGMVAARHLANRGVDVAVICTRPVDELEGVPRHQAEILDRMGVSREPMASPDLWVDAVIGYSLRGAPTGRSAELIERMNADAAPTISLDVPSGIDATTGDAPGVAVVAEATLTLAAPKTGLRTGDRAGALAVADISVPGSVFADLGHRAPDFSASPIVMITR